MDDMGQRGGGVFFMLTFSQPAYSFIEPLHEREHRRISHCILSCFNLGLTCLPQTVRGRSHSRLFGGKETLKTAYGDGG